MTPAQLKQIALDNAAYYERLAADSTTAAEWEATADIQNADILRTLRANAAYFKARADFYATQAATFTQGA